jgi:hypothetical protein
VGDLDPVDRLVGVLVAIAVWPLTQNASPVVPK